MSEKVANTSLPERAGRNILLIRLKSIGDILFTLPSVHAVRESFPDAKITFMVSKEHTALLEGFRDVDEVIGLDRALYHRGNPFAIVRETVSFLRRLRRGKFSLAIDLQGYGETAFFTRATGAPERWGLVYKPIRGWAYTQGVNWRRELHPAHNNLEILRECGLRLGTFKNHFVLPESAVQEARRFCSGHQCDPGKPILYIQPITSTPHKDWPIANYVALARRWRGSGGEVIFNGGFTNAALLDPVRAEKFIVAAGLPLLTGAGLMQLSTVIVGGDTGLLHLANAMGKRVVMLMRALTTFPLQHEDWAVLPVPGQTYADIGVERVTEACAHALAEANPELAAKWFSAAQVPVPKLAG